MRYESMTAKEYLNQAHRLDQRINSKLEQIASLHDLATKATVTYSDMPRNPNKGISGESSAVTGALHGAADKGIYRFAKLSWKSF